MGRSDEHSPSRSKKHTELLRAQEQRGVATLFAGRERATVAESALRAVEEQKRALVAARLEREIVTLRDELEVAQTRLKGLAVLEAGNAKLRARFNGLAGLRETHSALENETSAAARRNGSGVAAQRQRRDGRTALAAD